MNRIQIRKRDKTFVKRAWFAHRHLLPRFFEIQFWNARVRTNIPPKLQAGIQYCTRILKAAPCFIELNRLLVEHMDQLSCRE